MEGSVGWDDMAPFDRRLAVTETLAHLEALKGENRVVRAVKEDLAFYKAA
jgi:hypothetical protein